MTPVGMLSRIASVNRRRFSSSRLFASSSCVISLKARTSDGQFVDRVHLHAMIEVSLAHLLRGAQQRRDRNADLLRQEQRQPGRKETE